MIAKPTLSARNARFSSKALGFAASIAVHSLFLYTYYPKMSPIVSIEQLILGHYGIRN
jgi:hypothetical protein